ncbi:MAG: DUF4926 domain-containing protein [Deltaproteobacteria bacterium]|nr:DUF4926 domain-containing protein [Deltaproteobacteria bacterium]
MFQELDIVVLKRDIPEYHLKEGDIGAVVHCYRDRETFEVEFVTGQGETVALLTLSPESIRPVMGREILHVRGLEQVSSVN